MNETAAFLGPEDQWTQCRVELWEVDGAGTPGSLNAIASGEGRVDAQEVEWQVELRYRFKVDRADVRKTLRELVDADLLGVPTDESDRLAFEHRQSVRIVLTNASGETRAVDIANTREKPAAFRRSQAAIRVLVEPGPRGAKPIWSRGPTGSRPFP
jgi:hypothetical protein